ncbi:glycosyltransferase [Terrimicrobium sacchariphilum]|uniref:Glycosyltransferase n=1 Tax=Terrimicrobium sacchariphilum TaxID=690879 RepID=A0A146GCS3_TERSA|nr:glycosyltransferase [Terrimicrobium sacchariphilum]GAT35365.1 glycosyltransferase [Terrimicrobium sacchariphilum]
MTRPTLVSAAYPPDLDGIGDYTWWLGGALSRAIGDGIPVITRTGDHLAQEGVKVHGVFDPHDLSSVRKLPFCVNGGWLVFQYNPFSWGRRGWCPAVPEALNSVKAVHPHLKLAVMFHETTVPRWPWKFALMRRWQRPVFRKICKLADVAFASSERYVRQIEKVGHPMSVVHLPVGSNVARSSLDREEACRAMRLPDDAILVGVFGSAHESRLLDWIGAAFAGVKENQPHAKVLYVGPHGDAIARAVGDSSLVIDMGIQPSDRAGVCLSAMDLLLAPFNDGISTRRGSVIAAFQNGVPVATTLSKWTDSVFRSQAPAALLLSQATTAIDFARDTAEWATFLNNHSQKARYREDIQAFHDAVFSWDLIAKQLMEALQ